MQLEVLLQRLPRNAAQPVLGGADVEAFDVRPTPVDGYVSPTMSVEEWPENASVLLIEAAGAVGKSAAAAAAAHALNWPLVRAERAQVGSYSLSGLVHDALGVTSLYLREIATGAAGIIVDSLDEAHFRAGTDNFLAFLENIQKVSGFDGGEESRAPSVVIFSRSDTAEFVRLSFADASVPLAHAKLDFFSFGGTKKFLESYLLQRYETTGRSEYNVFRAAPMPYERLRDDRLRQVASVLLGRPQVDLREDWRHLSEFLGYAPVLIAIAESLAVSNPAAARSVSLKSTEQDKLLQEIIDSILRREQEKFSSHMQAKLHALVPADVEHGDLESNIYLPVEQCTRLASFVSGVDLATTLPATLPNAVRATYEEAASTFIADHPFVKGRSFASVVFSDHVAATTSRMVESRVALSVPPETLFEEVGPFFARFVANCDQDSGGATISESLVEHVISSWTQESDLHRSSGDGTHLVLSIFEEIATLTCFRYLRSSEDVSHLDFKVVDISGALNLKRPLKWTSIVTSHGLILGSRSQHLQLGPGVVVVADEVVIEAETLRIEADSSYGGLGMAAERISANYLTKVEAGPQTLSVFAEDPPAKLRPYRRGLSAGKKRIPFERFVDLRNILTAFKPSKQGARVHVDLLEQRVLRQNPHRTRILSELESQGLVYADGSWRYLDLAQLDHLGFGLHDVKSGEPSGAVLDFLATCLPDEGRVDGELRGDA